MKNKLKQIWTFIVNDIWDIELTSLSKLRMLGVKALRVINLVFKGFRDDECPLHASALTFNSLMAIVPILALSLSLARVFGGGEMAQAKIKSAISDFTGKMASYEQVAITNGAEAVTTPATNAVVSADGVLSSFDLSARLNEMVDSGFNQVEKISFAALGGVGLVLLVWMVIGVLGKVESSFNRVWGVTVGRSLWRKFTDYLSVLLILPVLIIAASSLPVVEYITRFLDPASAEKIKISLGSGILKNLMVIVMTSLSFAFLIMFMPNTKVRFRPALSGGFVAGLLFVLWLWLCAAAQVGVARWGKIYGSFAVVPIVLAWVYVSWQIVLFGAEVAFAVQNCATYRMEMGARKASVQSRVILALSIITEAGRAMLGKAPGFEISVYAREKRVSVRFLNEVVDELVQSEFLAKLSEDKPDSFVLLKSPEGIKVKDVINAIMNAGVKPDRLGLDGIDQKIKEVFAKASEGFNKSLDDTSIKELIA